MAIVFGIGSLTVGGTNVGILQNVSVDISTSQAELRGGGSLYPVAVVPTERSITGSAEFAEIDGALLAKVVGGTYATGTLTVTDQDAPVEFALVLKTPADGTDITLTLHRCVSTSLSMAFAYNDFVKPNFDFTAMAVNDGTANDGKVMTVVV